MFQDVVNRCMDSFQKIALQLKNASVEAIDETVAFAMQHPDERFIGPFLLSLDDAAQDDAGMFSLIHAAEYFEDETYVNELVAVLPRLKENSPKWASIVLIRVLNNEKTKTLMVRKLHKANFAQKQAVAWLCQKINERGSSFAEVTLPLLLASK